MPTSQLPASMADSGQYLKREEAFHRSLSECTTRRLTHFNPCISNHVHDAPVLTSRVQWNTGSAHTEGVPVRSTSSAMRNAKDDSRDLSLSPMLSEIDELMPSDDEGSPPGSRPSTATSHSQQAFHKPARVSDIRSNRSYSDTSDTERRQPSFPGNRDIIDSRYPSTSPSPPTQHSAELETPSPLSDVSNGWDPSYKSKSLVSLDLHLHPNGKPPSKDEKLDRVGVWRVESLRDKYYRESRANERYGVKSPREMSCSLSAYSPSITASSAPPSPRPVLPPISHLNATLPVNTGRTPGVYHWRFRETEDARHLKRVYPVHPGLTDDYDEVGSSAASPHSLPPLLPHIKMLAQGYPAQHPLPGIPPAPSIMPPPPMANPVRNKNAWKEYAQLVSGPNDQTEFRCAWRVGFTGEVTDHCGYTAKRHLVKRHIETRHLQFKDHICQFCGKAFPQRVSLMIHVNRHTGAKPHPCRYVDCDKTFSDPARRHKHMVEAHGYTPQGPRKRHRTVDSYHTNAGFETVAAWTAKDESSDETAVKA